MAETQNHGRETTTCHRRFLLACIYSLPPVEIVEDSFRPLKNNDTHSPRSFRPVSDSDIGGGTVYFRFKLAETFFLWWPRLIGNTSCATETRRKKRTRGDGVQFSAPPSKSAPDRPRSSKTAVCVHTVRASNLGPSKF